MHRLLKPLYGMPSAARAWHTTMSAFLAKDGCSTVGFECANRQVFDGFRARLLDAFEGTYEGPLQHYLRCEVTRDMEKGTEYLSQTHYAEEILRTYNSGMPLLALHPCRAQHAPQQKRL